MKRVHLDFVSRTWPHWFGHASIATWLCAGGLCVAVVAGGARLLWVHAALRNAEAELVAVQQSQRRDAAPRPSREQSLTPDQQKAFNRAITQLNQPWPVLLDALENTVTTHIALLSLNFEPASQRLRGTAEAKNFKSMMAFMERLDSGPTFHSAQLMSHHLDDATPAAPIRFEFAVDWRGGMP